MTTKIKGTKSKGRSDAERGHAAGLRSGIVVASQRGSESVDGRQFGGNLAVQRLLSNPGIQPKLSIGSPNDPLEQEADQVANAVVDYSQESASTHSPAPTNIIRRKLHDPPGSLSAISSDLVTSLGPGHPLDSMNRAFFEPRFGRDLRNVRIHSGQEAAKSARSIGAKAFALGNHVVLGDNTHDFNTQASKKLLAHELAHVVQQGDATQVRRYPMTDDEIDRRIAEINQEIASSTLTTDYRRRLEDERDLLMLLRGRAESRPMEPGFSPASGETPSPAQQAVPPEVMRRLAYAATVLRRVQPLPRPQEERLEEIIGNTSVYRLIRQRNDKRAELQTKRGELADYRARAESVARGERLAGGVPATPEMMQQLADDIARLGPEIEILDRNIQAGLRILGIADEASLVRTVEDEFPRLWINRAKQIANSILDTNREQVLAERRRYPPGTCSINIRELRAADQQLHAVDTRRRSLQERAETKRRERQSAEEDLRRAENLARDQATMGSLPGGVAPGAADIQNLQRRVIAREQEITGLNSQITDASRELDRLRSRLGRNYPILMVPGYYPGVFAQASDERVTSLTGTWTQELLDNIETTRSNIASDRIKVWHLRDVPSLTYQNLGVPEQSLLGEAVRRYTAGQESDERALNTARTVLEVALVIAATIATLPEGGVGGLIVGGLISIGHLAEDVQRFRTERAAEQVALDPLIADISVNEPNLLPLVYDVVFLVLNAIPVLRALRPYARALMTTRSASDFGRFAAEARRILPVEQAEVLIQRTARRLGVSQMVQSGRTISAASPPEIYFFSAELSTRQQRLLAALPRTLSRTIVPKRSVRVTDLAALTARTGDEFTLFTRRGLRLIIRGNREGVPLTPDEIMRLRAQGYRWSGHSHPGHERIVLDASGGDQYVLELMGQERSLILSGTGRRNVFDQAANRIIDE